MKIRRNDDNSLFFVIVDNRHMDQEDFSDRGSMSNSMIPNPTEGHLLIHIPRTGGNSIHQATGCYSHHRPARYVRSEVDWDWDSVHTFSIIRNPWDHAMSWWAFNAGKGAWPRTDNPVLGFREWVKVNTNAWESNRNWVGGDPIDSWNYITQDDEVIVSEVLKYENFVEDSKRILQWMGGRKMPHVLKSKHSDYHDYYDLDTMEVVRDRYRKLINHFGYEF